MILPLFNIPHCFFRVSGEWTGRELRLNLLFSNLKASGYSQSCRVDQWILRFQWSPWCRGGHSERVSLGGTSVVRCLTRVQSILAAFCMVMAGRQLEGGKIYLGLWFQRASIHPGDKNKGALQGMHQEAGGRRLSNHSTLGRGICSIKQGLAWLSKAPLWCPSAY